MRAMFIRKFNILDFLQLRIFFVAFFNFDVSRENGTEMDSDLWWIGNVWELETSFEWKWKVLAF